MEDLMTPDWKLDPDMPMDEILRRWPTAMRVLIDHDMLCIGCPIGPFHSVPEACAAHDVDEAAFVEALATAIHEG
jgi:hybrid cluster-associated redox disulfide protein